MDTPPNWQQLGYDAAHLAIVFLLVVVFVCALTLLAGLSLSHTARFFSKALKAEFTEHAGWLDLVLFFLFCAFVYGPPIGQDVLDALKLGHLGSDPQLVNPNLKLVSTLIALLGSLVFVGLYSKKPATSSRTKKK